MPANSVKSWNRSWTTQEIVDNASNWSLAGDAGLLQHLESFSDNLLAKAEETNNNLNKLLEGLNKASLSLDIVKNEFCSLQNTQFIENRVYEDDETLPAKEEQQQNVQSKKPSEEEKMKVMKEAVMKGIAVVDKYFEKVEVPASDSEDETDFPSFVLRPKDPYLDRPLPYIIGTEDWHKKWHVGLLDSSSDSEVDKVSEKFSDSDSEDDLPVQDRTRVKGISNSGSEADVRSRMNQPVANSTFDESVKQPDLFGSSDSEDYSSVPAHAPISTRNFAQELAAKLGHVVDQTTQPEINKRPIQAAPPPSKTIVGNIFSDEPPPIDGEDELFANTVSQQGLFSGGGGLFDDLDDNSGSLWKEKKNIPARERSEASGTKPKLPNLFDEEDDDLFNVTASHVGSNIKTKDAENFVPKKKTGGLFDDEADDIFQDSLTNLASKPYLAPSSKPSLPYFADEPPELEPKATSASEDGTKTKKPIGGIKIFGNADLFGQQKVGSLLKNRRQESSESSENENIHAGSKPTEAPKVMDAPKDLLNEFHDTSTDTDKPMKDKAVKETPSVEKEDLFSKTDVQADKKPKQLSLFDDDDSALFEDDLFSNISTKKFTSSLFDQDPLEDDLFARTKLDQSSNQPASKAPKTEEASKIPTTTTLEQPPLDRKPKTVSLFDDEDGVESDDLFPTNITAKSTQSSDAAAFPQPENRSFSESHKQEPLAPSSTLKSVDESSNKSSQPVPSVNFFDQNPPELDDEWDTKSENNLFEENDTALFDHTPEISSRRSGLFDNEPPSLFYESSGIVRDASARADTDDSFNPYASSSRRFSTDIFSEQQSNDSFFVTKNKSQLDSNTHSNLDSIPEISSANLEASTQSNLEITPSGNADDLFTDSTVFVSGAIFLEQSKANINANAEEIPPVDKVEAASQSVGDYDLFSKENDVHFEKTDRSVDSGPNLFEASEKVVQGKVKETENKEAPKPEMVKEKPTVAKRPEKLKDDNSDSSSPRPVIQDTVSSKIGSPGKLKHNLNINVGALMPGVPLPRKKDLEKSHSFEVASTYEDSVVQVSLKSDPNLSTQSKSSEELTKRPESQKVVEKSVSFDSPLDNPEVLPSITKDRARIRVKRRPSTRRARHESIRNSVPDFKIDVPVQSDPDAESEPASSAKADTSTESFEDIFADNDNDLFSSQAINVTQKEFSKIDEVLKKEEPVDKFKNIFMSDSPDSEPDLFAESKSTKIAEASKSSNTENVQKNDPLPEPMEQPKSSIFGGQRRSVINSDSFESADFKKSDLFDDSEEFDDIFSSKKLPPKSNILKKSLFDDDLDDDDIFGPPPTAFEKTSAKDSAGIKAAEKKSLKTTQVRKLENTEAVEDPLSSFMDN